MNKTIKFFVIGGIAFLTLTGCENKKVLNCDLTTDDSTINYKYTFDKSGKKLQNAEQTVTMEIPDGVTVTDDDLDEMCSELKTSDKITCKASKTDKQAKITVKLPVTKLSSEDLKSFQLEDLTYDEAKKELEEMTAKCK